MILTNNLVSEDRPTSSAITAEQPDEIVGFGENFDWRDKGVIPAVMDQGTDKNNGLTMLSWEAVQVAHAIYSGKKESLSLDQVFDCCSPSDNIHEDEVLKCLLFKYKLETATDYPKREGKCAYDSNKDAVEI